MKHSLLCLNNFVKSRIIAAKHDTSAVYEKKKDLVLRANKNQNLDFTPLDQNIKVVLKLG